MLGLLSCWRGSTGLCACGDICCGACIEVCGECCVGRGYCWNWADWAKVVEVGGVLLLCVTIGELIDALVGEEACDDGVG